MDLEIFEACMPVISVYNHTTLVYKARLKLCEVHTSIGVNCTPT
jgi:carbon monoxide dehydrogenase subunit G